MGKFLWKALFFATTSLLLIYLSGINLKPNENNSDYMAAIIEKHDRLRRVSGKRIIFVGGSNLAFGIDSKRIENELKIPVINLGLHAALGLEFIINEIKSNLKKEDIIIFSIEYYLGSKGDYKLKLFTANFFPEAHDYFAHDRTEELGIFIEEKKENLRSNFKLLFSKILPNANKKSTTKELSVYSRDSFNSHGDNVGHLNKKSSDKLRDGGKIKYRFYEGIDILNNFYHFAKLKNIKVYFLFPNYPKSEYLKNNITIEKYHLDLLKHLDMPLLNSPRDSVF